MATETKRKTPTQLQALEDFYSEEKYPMKTAMEDYAVGLGLTYKQVWGWFVERRRRDKKENGVLTVSSSISKKLQSRGSEKNGVAVSSRKILKKQSVIHGGKIKSSFSKFRRHLLESDAIRKGKNKQKSTRRSDNFIDENMIGKRKKKASILLQDLLLTPDYILKKVFRKDGPPLGVEFDYLPSRAFGHFKDSSNSCHAGPENQRALKRRKDCNEKSAPAKKHGIGKGLMTVWRATNPGAGDFPTGVDLAEREITGSSPISLSMSRRPVRKNKLQQQRSMKERKLKNKLQDKRKPPVKRREVVGKKDSNKKQPYKEICELALGGLIPQEHIEQFAMLVDDEELELRELQAGTNPLTCTSHFAGTGLHSCSLCKDLLARFPPSSVKMKQPFSMQPWVSSPEAVKKLFKVFHFLYTYAVLIDMRSFTLDEFAQAFHDKDSLLLGEVHVALLKVLLSDVEMELSSGFLPHLSKSCKFLGLLHSIEHQQFVVEFWRRSLNPLTWTEILRQVLVATGSNTQNGASQKEALKEVTRMVKYGLCPGTLKGELFSILSAQGNNGMKVSELARLFQIVELNLASTTDELEHLICSTMSSDITLFEKISSSAYRLRISSVTDEAGNFESDTEDSGSIDDNSKDNGTCSDSDESECDSGNSDLRRRKRMIHHKSRNTLTVAEIDESHPGEVWLLGLAEGEYSDLRIEEKLNALAALVDLLSAGSSIRMEDPIRSVAESIPNNHHYGSGAKIKRSSALQHHLLGPPNGYVGQMHSAKAAHTSSESYPIDSSALISKFCRMQESYNNRKDMTGKEGGIDLHPMQSVFLGSDRRYNRYWLFLGPCTANDPGHRRVYFESSEDGHWDVIDTEEALHALLSILDDRGNREARLVASLEKREASLCQEMSNRMANNYESRHSTISDLSELDREDSSSPVSNVDNNLCLTEISKDSLAQSGAVNIEVGRKAEEQQQKWSRLQAFDAWIWHSFYLDLHAVKHSKSSYLDSLARCESCHDLYWRDEKHCKICHATFELDFDLEERYAIHVATCRQKEEIDIISKHKVLSSQLQSLKAAIHAIESAMPEDSLVGSWTKSAHKVWVKRLRRTSSLAELLQVLTDFVGAINEEWLFQCNVELSSNNVLEEIITSFTTMPQTFSAVALWLVKLDAVIAPYLERDSSERHQKTGTKLRGKRALKQ